MTTQTIALLGGVVVLLLLLVAVRRRRKQAQDAPIPSRADIVDVSVPTPAATSGPARLFAAEGMSEAAPVPAPALAPAEPAYVQAVPAVEAVVLQSWSAGEIVREPGWLMPGEVDNVWQADFVAAAAVPAAAPVGAVDGAGHANGSANGHAAASMGSLVDEVPGFDPAAGWGGGALTVELERPEPSEETRIPQWDPVDDLPEAAGPDDEPPADLAMPSWSEDAMVGWSAELVPEPDLEAWAAQIGEAAVEPVAAEIAVEPVVPAPVEVAEPAVAPAPEELSAWPVAEWAVEAPAAPVAEVEVPAEPVVAWWDEEDPAVAASEPVPAAGAGTGRFALGGFALQPGHETISGVTFRTPLPAAPTAWAVDPAGDVAPGTLVLSVEGAINTGAEDVAVLMDEGFAPSAEGFTVRAAARAPGPFAVSGTFRVL